jgi:hypothetical protein
VNIPKVLKIGAHYVTVKVTPDVPNDNCGQYDIKKNEIQLNENQVQTQLEASLIHEILHAINITMSEQDIEFLSQALYQVIKDNKLVFDGVEKK